MATDIRFVSATPTLSASPDYSTGDLMGTSYLTFTGAVPTNTGTGVLTSVTITDKSGQVGNCDLALFTKAPTATTYTDNSAFAPDNADLSNVCAVVNLGTSNGFTFSANGVKHIASLAVPVRGLSASNGPSGTLYGVLVSRGTINIASASDLTITLGIVGS